MAKTILIVDDDSLARRSLATMLQQKGYSTVEAVNGKEGLEKALAGGIDLVVTDLIMPEMDGMAMLEALRKDAKGKDLRVVVLSNDEATTSVNKAMQVGVTTYLPKVALDLETVANQIAATLG
jgi:two-component system chemotaxis response regulator CheY